jgi:hypothetical protein
MAESVRKPGQVPGFNFSGIVAGQLFASVGCGSGSTLRYVAALEPAGNNDLP